MADSDAAANRGCFLFLCVCAVCLTVLIAMGKFDDGDRRKVGEAWCMKQERVQGIVVTREVACPKKK